MISPTLKLLLEKANYLYSTPGLRSDQQKFGFLFATADGPNIRLANGHVSAVYFNTSLIAHAMGDIGYFCIMKKTLWALHLCAL